MAPRDTRPTLTFTTSTALLDPQWYSAAATTSGPGRTIHTSGQTAQRADGSWPDAFPAQVDQALTNLTAALAGAGAQLRDVVKLTFYVVDWDLSTHGQPLVEAVVAALTTGSGESKTNSNKPVTTLVPVPKLAFPEAKFEIEATAWVGGESRPWSTNDASATTHTAAATPTAVVVDVVVVGGGFSGLMAAHATQQAGLTTVLLEAKHRVGGRSRTQRLRSGPGAVEMGATWINKTTQPTVYGLVQRFGLETAEQYTEGYAVFEMGEGRVVRAVGGDVPVGESGAPEEVQKLIMAIEEGAGRSDIRRWDNFPADEDVSVMEWLNIKGVDTSNPVIQALCSNMVSGIVGREPREVGAQYFLDYVQSGFGYQSLVSEGEMGAQSLKIKTGTSSIATSLASAMQPGTILLNSPVDEIQQLEHDSHPCLVTTSSGQRFKAKKVIMANPTNTYTDIHFTPPLPRAKRAVVSRTKPGIYAKALLTYKEAWWRAAGFSGKVNSTVGPICFGWDVCSDEQNSLAYFVAGDVAAAWHEKSDLQREEAIVEHLARLVGPELADRARDVLEFNCVEWTKEPYIWGAPTSAMGPGLLREYGASLREPVANIHLAGGEFAFEWKGYLEGALTSGQRAADEVIKELVGKV
ncbi:putative flavin-containing monoamine oxidase AofH [Lasiodiplodia theobromae]|uniref:Amine oxidase n=1 Tax=Lasiodiplodia theobromae TaxID=45133 RepID=A0A5N5DD64_9PEZI|nr:putative flavin-containing monoamine oxidase AofH [Lasiodiplodia theobromae]